VGGTLGTTLANGLRAQGHVVTVARLFPASGPASYDSARAAIDGAEIGLIAVAVRAREGVGSVAMPQELVQLIGGMRTPSMLVSFGSPYIISQAPSVPGYLLAWTPTSQAEEAVAAAFGGAAITGKLPVRIPPTFRIGDGLASGRTP